MIYLLVFAMGLAIGAYAVICLWADDEATERAKAEKVRREIDEITLTAIQEAK